MTTIKKDTGNTDTFNYLNSPVNQGAYNFLASISAVLDGTFQRDPFAVFGIYRPSHHSLGSLQRNIIRAYDSTEDSGHKNFIREVVKESFARVLCMPLGARRTRVVADVAHAIMPELMTPKYCGWLWRRDPERNPAEWWSHLIPRFVEWGVTIPFTQDERRQIVGTVNPGDLEAAVTWISQAPDIVDKPRELAALKNSVISRVVKGEEQSFWRDDERLSLSADRILAMLQQPPFLAPQPASIPLPSQGL